MCVETVNYDDSLIMVLWFIMHMVFLYLFQDRHPNTNGIVT